ncbi:unnamed protein product [Spirodela intermedia]|uniref:Uncharacterized protein n=1 Tax=Spirodela intermedia TaxID=51605 RepID=A0A7I8JR96_SPIIN|nr:unnamed protein product [Spirodela intermedia]CAA6672688.1 unnamed protein product [Spirodela intermedia]
MEAERAPWRILEFYSGIGGMVLVGEGGGAREVMEAFDINDCANDVYEHNFGHRPFQGNIQSLSSDELDKYGADAWLMSPPCQPYTRQGLQKHSADARASSFIKILELIPHMRQPPAALFVENVVGFETSDTHDQLIDILIKTGFTTQEYILSPLQFGIPYSRPRYFCLAKRRPLSFPHSSVDGQLLLAPFPFSKKIATITAAETSLVPCEPIKKFLQGSFSSGVLPANPKSNLSGEQNIDEAPDEHPALEQLCKACSYLDENGADHEFPNVYAVPRSLIERWGGAMDIVFPSSRRCCCFTKSYYRYVKGTGSLLATVQPVDKGELSLEDLGLRYFTPREVANLHSFPEDFDFPPHISLRQRYALLGNSLSVAVVAPLLRYLLSEPSSNSHRLPLQKPG